MGEVSAVRATRRGRVPAGGRGTWPGDERSQRGQAGGAEQPGAAALSSLLRWPATSSRGLSKQQQAGSHLSVKLNSVNKAPPFSVICGVAIEPFYFVQGSSRVCAHLLFCRWPVNIGEQQRLGKSKQAASFLCRAAVQRSAAQIKINAFARSSERTVQLGNLIQRTAFACVSARFWFNLQVGVQRQQQQPVANTSSVSSKVSHLIYCF